MKNRTHLVLILVLLSALSAFGQKSKPYLSDDDRVYDGRIQQVKGTVVYLEKDGEKIPASGQYLVFQRTDCKDCLVATHTDLEGNYKLFLGVGKYKLIVQFKNCGYAPVEDCAGHNYLASEQPQYLVVERGPLYRGEFNIQLVSPNR